MTAGAITYAEMQKYLATGGGTCPKCGSKDIHAKDYPGVEENNRIVTGIVCYACEAEWTDVYTLTGIAEALPPETAPKGQLRQLTQAEVLALQPGDQTEYTVELWRAYYPEPILKRRIKTKLYIKRTPAYHKQPDRLLIVAVPDGSWAEGGSGDVGEDGSILVEDYLMKIFVEAA